MRRRAFLQLLSVMAFASVLKGREVQEVESGPKGTAPAKWLSCEQLNSSKWFTFELDSPILADAIEINGEKYEVERIEGNSIVIDINRYPPQQPKLTGPA